MFDPLDIEDRNVVQINEFLLLTTAIIAGWGLYKLTHSVGYIENKISKLRFKANREKDPKELKKLKIDIEKYKNKLGLINAQIKLKEEYKIKLRNNKEKIKNKD